MLGFTNPLPGKLGRPNAAISASKKKKLRQGQPFEGAAEQMKLAKQQANPETSKSTIYIPTPFKGRGKRGKGKDGGDDSSSSSGSESFSQPVQRATFYDERRSDKVPLNLDLPNVTHLMELERPYQNSERISSKLYINMAQFQRNLPTAPPFTNVELQYQLIFDRLSREVVSKIRSASITAAWTYVNFVGAMSVVAQALSVFYLADALLSYRSSSTKQDKNWAVLTLAEQIATEDNLLAKDNLRKVLKGCWFPPKFAELIRWTYQIYKMNDLDQSVNYFFCPTANFLRTNPTTDVNNISIDMNNLMDGLANPDYVKIFSILADLMPEGRIVGLPLSCSEAVYDARHFELFSNQPAIVTIADGSAIIHPVTSSDPDGVAMYGLSGDPSTASGLPFALQSLWYDANTETIDFFRAFRYVKPGLEANYDIQQNKFKAAMSGDNMFFVPRSREDEPATDEAADIHIIEQNPSTYNVSTKVSAITTPFQPVYFNSATAPLITLRNFMDELFGLN